MGLLPVIGRPALQEKKKKGFMTRKGAAFGLGHAEVVMRGYRNKMLSKIPGTEQALEER